MAEKISVKWQTELEIVDITTGEMLQKSAVERKDYLILAKQIRYEFKEYLDKGYHGTIIKKGIKKITWEAIPNPQLKLYE